MANRQQNKVLRTAFFFLLLLSVSVATAAAADEPNPEAPPAPAAAEASAVVAESPRSAAERGRQQQREQWAVHVVNSEFTRSREGQWRRLFPSARGAEYQDFFDESRRPWHFLPFDL